MNCVGVRHAGQAHVLDGEVPVSTAWVPKLFVGVEASMIDHGPVACYGPIEEGEQPNGSAMTRRDAGKDVGALP